ncbi:MAG: sulfatase-like hydrolase/transferase, partial [Eudoraea sp.]
MRLNISLLLLLLLLGCDTKKEDTTIDKQPNIVLIMADDQGWGDLSIHGNNNLNTPNIDALAQNGVSFQNFYVQPVCSPTRAEMLCGRQFQRLGVYATSAGGERLNLNETTLAEVFKMAGYQTAAYGKWHNG